MRDAVGADLVLHLRDQLARGPLRPVASFAAAEEESCDGEQSDDVREVVVAASLAPLEVGADEPPVQEQALERALEPRLVGCVGGERERGHPVRRADRDVHRRHPVDAELDRVGLDPALELGAEPRPRARRREQGQVLEAGQLPRHLDVGAVLVRDPQQRALMERPRAAGLEVLRPVDLPSEIGGARAEQVEAMLEEGRYAGIAGSASNRATVGIASSTGPRSASTGSAPPSAALRSSLPTRSGRARSRASRAAPFPSWAAPRSAALVPTRRQSARPWRNPTLNPLALARRSSSRARRSRCRCSRAGRPSRLARPGAPARGRRSCRSRGARARRATSCGSPAVRARRVVAEPFAHRRREALLRSVHDLGRQQARDRLLQQVLPLSVAHLHLGRQRQRELDEVAVEERNASLDRVPPSSSCRPASAAARRGGS